MQEEATALDMADILKLSGDFARKFASGAAERDRERRFPHEAVAELKKSPLAYLTVLPEYGGLGGSYIDAVRVIGALAEGDSNIAQIAFIHLHAQALLHELGKPAAIDEITPEVVSGHAWWTNAYSEVTGKTVVDYQMRVQPSDGGWTLNGKKFYCTGSLGGDEMYVNAVIADSEDMLLAFVPTKAPGVTIHDDWDAMGQRTTASGTMEFTDVFIPEKRIAEVDKFLSLGASPDTTLSGVFPQNAFTAIMVGIAKNALADAVDYVASRARPWMMSGVDRAADDPYVQLRIGQMASYVAAADALWKRALEAFEVAYRIPSAETRGEAAVWAAKARTVAVETALDVSEKLFQVCGSSASLAKYGLDRHWRNARTLSLHDPIDYKTRIVGDHALNGNFPPVTIYT